MLEMLEVYQFSEWTNVMVDNVSYFVPLVHKGPFCTLSLL